MPDLFRTRNAAMREVLQTVEKVLDHDVSILILGESGVGKDYLAESIHACSARRGEPFVHVDCASIPHELFESELFGYERGTFTDAQSRKLGKLELAQRGTVYFDEIAALTPPLQAKLLRAIEERRFTRLGGHQPLAFEARVVSSSNADMPALLASGAFRRDLFYRINVVTITLPPLRDRKEDILPLAKSFAAKRTIDAGAKRLLQAHTWPGNIRELRNAVDRAALLTDGAITETALPLSAPADMIPIAARAAWTLEELESRYIREILRQTHSNYSQAAKILGINRKTLLEKRRKYQIE
ncbi:MAG TPA: sigma-54 dependent transcriptional regulator [Thermoanaerobaculia bacterium]